MISGVATAGYNGTFTVTTVPGTRTFTYKNPISGPPDLPAAARSHCRAFRALARAGNTVTVSTVAAHSRSVVPATS